ncbi:hypothetical protein [Cerasicoccus maritimus]|uniref:hypothetical protein n=1 Tax=Cerasicoccus maritimus TaxID=490089 RepID=UPI002852AB55|nr:hypothetical protein [Cerasicoccus maritimus]
MKRNKNNLLGIIGCILGFIALVAAFYSPEIAAAIGPPTKPLEENVVDFAIKLKEAAESKAKGVEYHAEPTEPLPSAIVIDAIIAAGLIAAGFGLASLIRKEQRAIAAAAMCLGVGAAVVQISILVAAALIFVILVIAALSYLGIEFPSA